MHHRTESLPRWNMEVVWAGLDAPAFRAELDSVGREIAAMTALFDAHSVDGTHGEGFDETDVETLETILTRLNELLDRLATLRAFIAAYITTDSRNEAAQATLSVLQREAIALDKLDARLTAWIGTRDIDALIDRSEVAATHAHVLRRTKIEATHLMGPEEEALAAELGETGGAAWSKLHGNFTSQLTVDVTLEDETHTLPMSAVRNLASDPTREVRRNAYEAELAAWERAAVPIAAALNSIKGEVNALSKRRGWKAPLDAALFRNGMDRETLDAMMGAAREAFVDFRRYLRTKARALGLDALAWYDLFAPVGTAEASWPYERAKRFILEQFATYSERLHDLATRAFDERWIDAEPRGGKRDGAFCMWLRRGESRILTNYRETYNGVNTLAHELGHAYHNLNLADRTPLQRRTPQVLAETASTFCETIVRDAALKTVPPDEQLTILEASLQSACQIVVDITSRFLFESRLFEQRAERELGVSELNALMLDAQRETYADGLDDARLHPYMWAAKPHYYGSNFYNFPYMFGLLFGLGLYARYRQDPASFREGYDLLLSRTGMEETAALARRFGIDIRSGDFWRESLGVIRGEIDRFESLVDRIAPA